LTIWGGVREIKAPDYATFLAGMRPWILSLLSVGAGIDGIIAFSMIWYLMNKRQNSAKRYVYVM
jgi:hypothetical protein